MLAAVLLPLLAICPLAAAVSWEVVRDPQDGQPVFTTAYSVPAVPAGVRLPAIIAFHGGEHHVSQGDGDDREYVEEMQKAVDRVGDVGPWILIAPQSPGRGWRWDVQRPEVLRDLRRFTAWMLATLPVDPRRICYIGRSNGGASAGPIALDQPALYAGLMPWTGGPEADFTGIDPARFPDFYLVASAGEEAGWHAQIIDRLRALRGQGVRAIYRQPEGQTHISVHQRTDIYDDGLRWFAAVRNRSVAPPEADRALLARLAERRPLALTAGELAEVERIGGAEAQVLLRAGLAGEDAALRLACLAACTRTIAVPETTAALAAAARAAEPAQRQAAIRALGVQGHWRDLAAQAALCALAADRTAPADARRAALEATYAVLALDQAAVGGIAIDPGPLAVNVEETAILRAWAAVLEERDPQLGRIAAAGLAAFGADLAGWAPGDAPPAGLAAWLQQRIGG